MIQPIEWMGCTYKPIYFFPFHVLYHNLYDSWQIYRFEKQRSE